MANVEDVYLERLEIGDEQPILDMIQQDAILQRTFSGGRNTLTRLINSDYSAMINNGEENVGFVMLVYNGRNKNYEVDMGILTQFRRMGYGTKALELLKDVILANKIEVEIQTKKVNVAAIRSITKNGFKLHRQDEECYYFKLDEKERKTHK